MNDDEKERWSGERATRWIEMAAALEAQLAPVSELLFERAALRPGESVLDVGCGTGPTTRRAARLVGGDGRVVGADVSAEMIEAASDRSVTDESASIEWVVADAASWHPPRPFDVVISRFGVMFFDDPEAAFANLAAAASPGGRLCVAVWSTRESSAIFERPLRVTLEELADRGIDVTAPPSDAGPFSLGTPDDVVSMLGRAGWTDAEWHRHTVQLPVGGGVGPDEAAVTSMSLGPVRAVTDGLAVEDTDAVRSAIASAYASELDADGHVVIGATVGIVTAMVGPVLGTSEG